MTPAVLRRAPGRQEQRLEALDEYQENSSYRCVRAFNVFRYRRSRWLRVRLRKRCRSAAL